MAVSLLVVDEAAVVPPNEKDGIVVEVLGAAAGVGLEVVEVVDPKLKEEDKVEEGFAAVVVAPNPKEGDGLVVVVVVGFAALLILEFDAEVGKPNPPTVAVFTESIPPTELFTVVVEVPNPLLEGAEKLKVGLLGFVTPPLFDTGAAIGRVDPNPKPEDVDAVFANGAIVEVLLLKPNDGAAEVVVVVEGIGVFDPKLKVEVVALGIVELVFAVAPADPKLNLLSPFVGAP